MIEKDNYVFIIGAGASMPYGFPSGNALFNIIKDEVEAYAKEFIDNPIPSVPYNSYKIEGEAKKFAEALRLTEGVSIDKYININSKFEQIGIKSIIAAIIRRESNDNLPIYNRVINDNWYSYLFQKMIEGLNNSDELLQVYKNKITFVTFNYDRSLEQYLYLNLLGLLKNSGKNENEITQSIKKIKIYHVYGQVGLLPWQAEIGQDDLILDYGKFYRSAYENAERISSLIDVMYSKRKNSVTINKIRESIKQATRILFLGFGYDDDNMKLIGFPIDGGTKRINGTAFEKTPNEIIHLENKVFGNHVTKMHARTLFDYNSTKLLKEYLV